MFPHTGAMSSIDKPLNSENDLQRYSIPFSSQNFLTISRDGGRYPAMPSSIEMQTRSIPFRELNMSLRMDKVTMLSFPPDTATPIVSPRVTEISRRTSLLTTLCTWLMKCSGQRWAPLYLRYVIASRLQWSHFIRTPPVGIEHSLEDLGDLLGREIGNADVCPAPALGFATDLRADQPRLLEILHVGVELGVLLYRDVPLLAGRGVGSLGMCQSHLGTFEETPRYSQEDELPVGVQRRDLLLREIAVDRPAGFLHVLREDPVRTLRLCHRCRLLQDLDGETGVTMGFSVIGDQIQAPVVDDPRIQGHFRPLHRDLPQFGAGVPLEADGVRPAEGRTRRGVQG